MAEGGTASKIPSLKDSYESWRCWKMHLQAVLIDAELWQIVGTGAETRPETLVVGTNVLQATVQEKSNLSRWLVTFL
jgi:hypothetical protein